MDQLSESGQAGAEIEVTDRMVEAGLDVLHRSGAVETPLSSDSLLVSEIFQSMATVMSRK